MIDQEIVVLITADIMKHCANMEQRIGAEEFDRICAGHGTLPKRPKPLHHPGHSAYMGKRREIHGLVKVELRRNGKRLMLIHKRNKHHGAVYQLANASEVTLEALKQLPEALPRGVTRIVNDMKRDFKQPGQVPTNSSPEVLALSYAMLQEEADDLSRAAKRRFNFVLEMSGISGGGTEVAE